MVEFVGREEDLERLHGQLQRNERVAISAIAGMGGIGKTELALQYALRYWEQHYRSGVCWVRARELDVGTQIVNFGRVVLGLAPPEEFELADQVAYCWRNWRVVENLENSPQVSAEGGRGEGVLVVFDDVTDYREVEPYLPPGGRFTVLMTTRLRLGRSVQSFEIEVLGKEAALELLGVLAERRWAGEELERAKALCEWLGYLPLGLELVGRYLSRKPDVSLDEMQRRLEGKRLEAKALSQTEVGMTAQLGVAAAFELSWQELDEAAQRLGCLLSLFALAPIPWSLVEECCPEPDREDLEDCRDEGLVSLHLLRRVEEGEGWYQLHQLVRQFLRGKLDPPQPPLRRGELESTSQSSFGEGESDGLKRQFCEVMVGVAEQIPQSPVRALIVELTVMMPHVAEAAMGLVNWVKDEDLIWPFVGLGRFYGGQGAYAEAAPWYEQCLEMTRKRLGAEHPDVARSLNNLAALYKSQGHYEAAEPLYLEALAMNKRLLGAEHPDVARSLNNLAALYDSQGRYEAAEPLYLEALAMNKRLLGAEHPDVALSLNNLAALYDSQGRYEAAEPLYLEALAIFEQRLGREHPYTKTVRGNLEVMRDRDKG